MAEIHDCWTAEQAAVIVERQILGPVRNFDQWHLEPAHNSIWVVGGLEALVVSVEGLEQRTRMTVGLSAVLQHRAIPTKLAPVILHGLRRRAPHETVRRSAWEDVGDEEQEQKRVAAYLDGVAAVPVRGFVQTPLDEPYKTSKFVRAYHGLDGGQFNLEGHLKLFNLSIFETDQNRLVRHRDNPTTGLIDRRLDAAAVVVERLILAADTADDSDGRHAALMIARIAILFMVALHGHRHERRTLNGEALGERTAFITDQVRASVALAVQGMLHGDEGRRVVAAWVPRLDGAHAHRAAQWEWANFGRHEVEVGLGNSTAGDLERQYRDLLTMIKAAFTAGAKAGTRCPNACSSR
ncbi:hypothetical protein JCM8208_003078 [Rhodotorula glutinis]